MDTKGIDYCYKQNPRIHNIIKEGGKNPCNLQDYQSTHNCREPFSFDLQIRKGCKILIIAKNSSIFYILLCDSLFFSYILRKILIPLQQHLSKS